MQLCSIIYGVGTVDLTLNPINHMNNRHVSFITTELINKTCYSPSIYRQLLSFSFLSLGHIKYVYMKEAEKIKITILSVLLHFFHVHYETAPLPVIKIPPICRIW